MQLLNVANVIMSEVDFLQQTLWLKFGTKRMNKIILLWGESMSDFKFKTTLHSRATVTYNNEIINGTVTMITERGINLKTKTNTIFYRWHQVLNIVK